MGETHTGGWVYVLRYLAHLAGGSASQSSGAAFATGTQTDPPRAYPQERANATMLADTVLGANVGAGVRTGDGLCRPPLQQVAC